MLQRGIQVSHEAIRAWCRKFGQTLANQLRRRHRQPDRKWHLDEMRVVINGEIIWLWRAVDTDGVVLDILAQKKRDKKAAKRFFKKLLRSQKRVPRVIITDKLKSYVAARKEVLPSVEHRQHKGLNNRAENSHQPTRERERRMRRFKSMGQMQRFLAAFGPIGNHFRPRRHRLKAADYRQTMRERFRIWNEGSGLAGAA